MYYHSGMKTTKRRFLAGWGVLLLLLALLGWVGGALFENLFGAALSLSVVAVILYFGAWFATGPLAR